MVQRLIEFTIQSGVTAQQGETTRKTAQDYHSAGGDHRSPLEDSPLGVMGVEEDNPEDVMEKQPKRLHPSPCPPINCADSQVGVVRLLQAVKVPAHYQKLVRTKIDGSMDGKRCEPDAEGGVLQVADAVLDGKCGACQTLIVNNFGTELVCLEFGVTIGTVTSVEEAIAIESDPTGRGDQDTGTRICSLEQDTDANRISRKDQLLQQLG